MQTYANGHHVERHIEQLTEVDPIQEATAEIEPNTMQINAIDITNLGPSTSQVVASETSHI